MKTSEAKPICVIKVSREAVKDTFYFKLQELFQDRMPDYHVFCLPAKDDPSEPQEYFTFEVFYDKDFIDIDYNALKLLISESLN